MAVSKVFKVHSEQGTGVPLTGRPLLWLNCLCLDAPVVAVAWQGLFAVAFHFPLASADRLALFLTAWWIYLVDRLADSLAAAPSVKLTARAAFCLRHRRVFAFVLALVGLGDALLVITALDRPLIKAGVVLGGIALVYLFVNFRYDRLWKVMPLKELSVGFLFACGTAFVFMVRGPSKFLFFAVFLFGCLCSLNCLSIAVWERDLDVGQGKHSWATEHPRWIQIVRPGCFVIAFVSCALAVRAVPTLLAASLVVGSGLLLALHFVDLRRDERSALADLALLIPAVIFILPALW